MGIALQVPQDHLIRALGAVAILIFGVMPLTALATGVIVGGLGQVSLPVAAAIGAVLCPTDPIVASAITSSELAERSVPHRVRHLIEAESGANDALAYPLVMLPLLVLVEPLAQAEHTFLVQVMAYQMVVGGLFGAAVGIAVGWVITWTEKRAIISRDAFVAYPVALAAAVLYFADLMKLSGIFAVFCAGIFLVLTSKDRSLEVEVRARNTISQFFELPLFFILGLLLPWGAWAKLGWRGGAVLVAVLLLRRLPAVLLLGRWISPLRALPERLFAGWFGPVGISSFFYAALALRMTHAQAIWSWATLVIAGSVLVNGLTSTWLTQGYARWRPDARRSGEAVPAAPPPDGGDGRAARRPR
jgi:NhaP-type Na+/H+ or K+/H+ antiporter